MHAIVGLSFFIEAGIIRSQTLASLRERLLETLEDSAHTTSAHLDKEGQPIRRDGGALIGTCTKVCDVCVSRRLQKQAVPQSWCSYFLRFPPNCYKSIHHRWYGKMRLTCCRGRKKLCDLKTPLVLSQGLACLFQPVPTPARRQRQSVPCYQPPVQLKGAPSGMCHGPEEDLIVLCTITVGHLSGAAVTLETATVVGTGFDCRPENTFFFGHNGRLRWKRSTSEKMWRGKL